MREGAGRPSRSIPGSEPGVVSRNLGFFYHGSVFRTPDLLATDRLRLSQGDKRIFAQELAELNEKALNYI